MKFSFFTNSFLFVEMLKIHGTDFFLLNWFVSKSWYIFYSEIVKTIGRIEHKIGAISLWIFELLHPWKGKVSFCILGDMGSFADKKFDCFCLSDHSIGPFGSFSHFASSLITSTDRNPKTKFAYLSSANKRIAVPTSSIRIWAKKDLRLSV